MQLSIYLSTYVFLSINLSLCLSTYLSICLSVCLSICLSVCLSVYLQAWKRSYFATLPQFLNVTTSTTRNSARLPQFWNLTPSKTKQFCETSSIFELDNKKRSNSARLPSKWKVECRADGLVPMRFAIFPLHLSKVLRMPRKSDARSYEVLHLSRKIISANLKIWCSKMQPLSGNQRPDLLTTLMNMSLVLRLPRKMHLCRSSSNVPRLPSFLEMLQNPHVLLTFDKVHNPLRLPRKRPGPELVKKWSERVVFLTFGLRNVLRATTTCTFSTSQLPKVVRTWCALYILTWKCASRHNGVHFFDIATSKSAPNVRCFVAFSLTTCASRHNGVQFFISHLASWLRTRRFSEPTFRPSGATNHWKNTVFRELSYLFAHLDLLSSETFSFWSSFFFSSLLFSYSSHLCFSFVHIVGSLTSWWIFRCRFFFDIPLCKLT